MSDVNCNNGQCFEGEMNQSHVHEFIGSTKIAEAEEEPHNHRFAGVTSEAIPCGNSHVHSFLVNTDFYEDHHHEVGMVTMPAIFIGNGKHIHLVKASTTCDDGHFHDYIFTTLINNPIGD